MEKLILNGVIRDENPDPRNYNISQFVPGQDIITDAEFMLNLPELDIILNQECYSSCVGHAFILAKQILEYNRTNKWLDLDPYMLYGTRFSGDYNGIGMIPHQGARVLYKEGAFYRRDFGIEQEMPQLKDTVISWKSQNPDKVKEAEKLKITGYSFVHDINGIKKALKNIMPVSAAWEIFDSFYNVKDDGKVSVPKYTEKSQGYHQMLIVGWTKNKEWVVLNSWGIKHGFKGVYFIPFDYKFDSAISVSDTITPLTYKAKEIIFKVNDQNYIVDGVKKEFDSLPYIKNNRTYVPVRFITESLGASVEWIESTKEVIVRSEEAIIKMIIGKNVINVDGKNIIIDVAPEIVNNRTMLPIRAISEHLNCKVDWDANKNSVIIKAL